MGKCCYTEIQKDSCMDKARPGAENAKINEIFDKQLKNEEKAKIIKMYYF